jgi:SecD/SecF fusion protein
MQNKGLVKLFAVLFGLVSIYQLAFSFKNSAVESEANNYAVSQVDASANDFKEQVSAVEANYLDSLKQSKDKIFLGNTYAEVKENSMKLGLDLKGGLNVILQVSVKDILKGLANNTTDVQFNKALDDTDEIQKDSQNTYLEDFYKAFEAAGDKKLASPDVFATRSLSEEIKIDFSNDDAQAVLDRKVDESITSALEVLRTRIDQFGVSSPNIQRLGTSGRILVELPGVKDVERATELITSTAQLEFWDAYKGQEFLGLLIQANDALKASVKPEATEETADATEKTMKKKRLKL